jgi:hypothetical protein
MSFREWCALKIFEDCYLSLVSTGGDGKYTDEKYTTQLGVKLNIPRNESGCFLDRLSRTGLYMAVGGVDLKDVGGLGQLTARYVRLKHLLQNG